MTNSGEDSEGSKLLLTVAEAAQLMGVGEKRLRTLMAHRPDFPLVRYSPHRVLVPRGRLFEWLGYTPVADASPVPHPTQTGGAQA